jgi:hypothetical protein
LVLGCAETEVFEAGEAKPEEKAVDDAGQAEDDDAVNDETTRALLCSSSSSSSSSISSSSSSSSSSLESVPWRTRTAPEESGGPKAGGMSFFFGKRVRVEEV